MSLEEVTGLLKTLPAQMLVLVLLNLALVGGLLWHESRQDEARTELIGKLVESCGRH